MEKTLRILALVGVIGAFGIVAARGFYGDQGQIASKDGDHGGRPAYKASNAVQKVLKWHFINRQNAEIELAQATGKDSVVDNVIKVNCYYVLTVEQPDEQKHEINDVWQTSKWVPNDAGWAAVSKAPSLVHELLTVDTETLSKVQAKWDEVEDAFMKPYRDAIHRAAATPGFDSLPELERNRLIQKETDKVNAGRSIVERSAASVVRSKKVIDYVRSLLSPAQKAEFDQILGQFNKALDNVVAGKAPTFINP